MSESAQISLDAPATVFQNKQLFTEHYLEHRVTQDSLWKNPEVYELAKQKLAQLRALRTRITPENLDEAQLEKEYLHAVLEDILGHAFGVQVKLDYGDDGYGKPDMLFTATAEQARSLDNQMYTAEQLRHAIAVGDAKAWGSHLDRAAGGKQSPAQQLDKYLRYSEVPWGILTDGRTWRLYERNSSKFNHYYQVDLEAILERDEVHQFYYFYLFFRREAFTTAWLANVLRGSQDYAEALRDSLENEVFQALENIAQGFLDYRRNHIDQPPTEATLKRIYEESLVLLYRLLFVFYAESRGILPINHANSLAGIARNAAHKIKFPGNISKDTTELYSKLADLFFQIDAGDETLGIPAYNGKLFSGTAHQFLQDKKVGDVYLAQAIHQLATIEVRQGRETQSVSVDYQDLDVGHLGTIYEKLLEYRLGYTAVDLVTSGKKQTYQQARANQTPDKPAGSVYLRTGNNERKVTGSYYTPAYIVRFIVEKTIHPLLLERTERHATLDAEGNWEVHDPAALRDAILGLNVLDPATGSGHFAVDVVVYIAEWLHQLALDLPEVATEADPLAYWMRQVAGTCVYAVDINPLAVELAKLSIWLKTLAKDKPLSFLDHHIRVGNSLVGTRLAEIEDLVPAEPKPKQRRKAISDKQAPLFAEAAFTSRFQEAVSDMLRIERVQADDVDDVKQQEQLYAQLRAKIAPYEVLATVWTARYFGLSINDADWRALYTTSLSDAVTLPPRLQKIVDEAQAIAARPDLRFFHWDVAFPEVFFDVEGNRLSNPGFDAVVGNPPYVRQERIQSIKPFLQTHYDVYSGTADLFIYFYELGLQHLREACRLGYITSGTYMNSNSARAFRQYIHDNAAFDTLVDFGAVQPFRGVDLPTNVMVSILSRTDDRPVFRSLFIEGKSAPNSLNDALRSEGFDTLPDITGYDEWRFQPKELTQLFYKLTTNHPKLSEIARSLSYGIKTGFNEAFFIDQSTRIALIDQHPSSAEVIKPLAQGQDLRPWYQSYRDQFLIFMRHGSDISLYPAIAQYLEQYRTNLEPKPEDWNDKTDGRWQGRKSGPYQWYEIQDQVTYFQEFEGPKILFPDIAKFPRFSWDEGGLHCNDKGSIIVTNRLDILALLNSRAIWFVFGQIGTPLAIRQGLWRYQAKLQFVKRLPIPDLTTQQESDLAAIAEEITGLARSRYGLHEDFRQTLVNEFEGESISTRVALYRWWELDDEKALSDEIKRRFGQEIPLGKRSEWRGYLAAETARHADLTAQIVALETRLNAVVYAAFALTPEERQLIEAATKYPYGAV